MPNKIKNIESLIIQLKPMLKRYLEDHDTQFNGTLFKCPNREQHNNGDAKPSCGFVPETNETIFHCFSCGVSGDLYTAFSYLENKPIHGSAFPIVVKELADKYQLAYETEQLSPTEEEQQVVTNFMQSIIKAAAKYLNTNKPPEVMDFIFNRGWTECIEEFEFGYLPDTPEIKAVFDQQYDKYSFLNDYVKISAFQLTNRLIYPIKDSYGNLIGIGDRAISSSDSRSKYQKHTLKTLERGSVMFNLKRVYPELYLVEGGSSVFTMVSKGIKNSVAMLGCEFTEAMYKQLVRHGVKKVIFCFDADDAGKEALDKTIQFFEKHPDLKAAVKILPTDRIILEKYPHYDPDDCIKELGSDGFKKIPEESIFKYQINKFKATNDDLQQDEIKRSLFEQLSNTTDKLLVEKMINLMSQELSLNKKLILSELQRFEGTRDSLGDVGVSSIIAEEEQLINQIDEFEERALRAGKLLGISTGFGGLDSKIDGLQPGLILVSGKWNSGKSSFLQSIILNMAKDPSNYILYFSIDDSVIGKTIPRLLANISMIPINTISKPIHAIEQNEMLHESERINLKRKREDAIRELKLLKGRIGLKDASEGCDVKYIEKIIKTYRTMAGDRNLVVLVDFLNMVNPMKNAEKTEQESILAGFFKRMSTVYNCPVICTVESTKEILTTKTTENSIKGSSSLQFRSDLTLLLYSDFESIDQYKMLFFDSKGEANPIVKVQISKNKMGSFRGATFYKFYRNCNRFEEVSEMEHADFIKRF